MAYSSLLQFVPWHRREMVRGADATRIPWICWFAFAAPLLVFIGRAATIRADSSTTAPSDNPPGGYECRWTDKPITLDGKADEEAWKHAQTIDNFRAWWLKGDAQKPHTSTSAKLLWDDDYLYFFAEMQDADISSSITEHQGMIWLNDVFELFFKPSERSPAYLEFEVGPHNNTLELYFPDKNSGGYPKLKDLTKIKLETVVTLHGTLNDATDKDQGWSIEGRIPWRDLAPTGGRPKAGDTWKFTLCRVDYSSVGQTKEMSTSAPLTRADFHRSEDYSPLKFVGPAKAEGDAAPNIAKRALWTNSHVVGSPDGPLPYTVEKAFANLKVFQPLYILEEPGTDNYLLLQHLGSWSGPGRLLRFKNDRDVDKVETLLDIDGLAYGMALHPDFLRNGFIYVMSNGPVTGGKKRDRISRYTLDRQPPYHIDPKSELVILEWDSNGHDGGDLAFGPDGYLYHASGDGSADSDANLRGQDITHLNSAMLRLDVDHPAVGKAYSIPPDNPFINTPGARPEIWAYGFRNPWRIAFDRVTGQLWVGQNGQDLWEAVYLVHKGENYGWSVYEGSHPFNLNRTRGPTPITFPVVEHPHSEMRSLSGGVVYYGDKLPELRGAYIYGDWSTGRIWAVKHDGKQITFHKELARTTLQIVSFRETRDGQLLVVDQGGGIYQLIPSPSPIAGSAQAAAQAARFPTLLSETGLFLSTKENIPDPALIPYDVNAALWSDGATKERFIAIPGDGKLEVTPQHGWNCPEGTVLVKTFSLESQPGNATSRRRVETRLLTKQTGQWVGYSYEWNADQTDATLVPAGGVDRDYTNNPSAGSGQATSTGSGQDSTGVASHQSWHFPSRAECMTCHSRAANFVLGISTPQLNREHDYAGVKENQLREMEMMGVLQGDFASIKAAPRLVDPYDAGNDLELRARSYLHANCAICHIEAGGGNALMNLDITTPLDKAMIVDSPPQHETFGIVGAKLIAPGDSERSVLLHRMNLRGQGQMPPLASGIVDERGMAMLKEWVGKMKRE